MRGNVTNYILGLSVLLMLTSCSSATNENIDIVEEDAAKVIPTVKERDAWLDSNEFIMEYEHTDSTERNGQVYLKVKMNDDFAQKKISEQYLYLIDFYEEYDEKYSKLIPPYSFLNSLDVFFGETEFPTYVVFYATFSFEAVNISIDRETGQRPTNNVLQLLDSLDTAQIMSGTHSGLTLSE